MTKVHTYGYIHYPDKTLSLKHYKHLLPQFVYASSDEKALIKIFKATPSLIEEFGYQDDQKYKKEDVIKFMVNSQFYSHKTKGFLIVDKSHRRDRWWCYYQPLNDEPVQNVEEIGIYYDGDAIFEGFFLLNIFELETNLHYLFKRENKDVLSISEQDDFYKTASNCIPNFKARVIEFMKSLCNNKSIIFGYGKLEQKL